MSGDAIKEAMKDLGVALIKLSGIYESMPDLIDAIEEDIAGRYEAIKEENEDEEAEYYPDAKDNWYGGQIYETYHILKNGIPNDVLRNCDFNDKQKSLLNLISDNGNLSLSVNRGDTYEHRWGMIFSVPKAMSGDSERFEISLNLNVSANNPKNFEIEVLNYDDIDAETIKKIALMFQLKYS